MPESITKLDLVKLIDTADWLLTQVQQDFSVLVNISGLTPAEREVLALIAQGLSDRAIAERRCVTVRTVETQLASIYAKIEFPPDVHRRSWLVSQRSEMVTCAECQREWPTMEEAIAAHQGTNWWHVLKQPVDGFSDRDLRRMPPERAPRLFE